MRGQLQSSEATTETRHAVTRSRPSHILSLDSELVQPLFQNSAQRMQHHLMTGLESIASSVVSISPNLSAVSDAKESQHTRSQRVVRFTM